MALGKENHRRAGVGSTWQQKGRFGADWYVGITFIFLLTESIKSSIKIKKAIFGEYMQSNQTTYNESVTFSDYYFSEVVTDVAANGGGGSLLPQVGDKVMEPIEGFLGWADYLLNGRKYLDTYSVNSDGVITGIAPIAGLGSMALIGGPLRKGQQAIKLGKYLFNPTAFHEVKQGVLAFAKPQNFAHIVGKNPDLMFKGGKVFLTGAKNSSFFGKSYETSLSVIDFLKLF